MYKKKRKYGDYEDLSQKYTINDNYYYCYSK